MKTIFYILAILAVFELTSNQANAQSWESNTKILSIGLGASQFFHLDNYYYGNSNHLSNYYSPMTGQFNFQGEFGIHKYVGIGFTTGIGGRSGWAYDYAGELNIPIGMLCNFHFYQLIADKTGKDIHADVLDIYGGISAGSGLAFTYYSNTNTRVVPLAFGGPHVGIRWYFTERTALNAELGYGKSLVNVGFAFKL